MLKLKYPKNPFGRDFVCGDLHGSLTRLCEAMEFIGFNKNTDRMFSVGDLVDRGPDSLGCLRLLNEPWFFAVRGNHEQLMNDYYTEGPYGYYWSQNGGRWGILEQENKEVLSLSLKASELPLMISVEQNNGSIFHVIHAELATERPLTDQDLEIPELFAASAFKRSMDGDAILWGRWLFGTLYAKEITPELIAQRAKAAEMFGHPKLFNPRLSPIYSGHTIMQQPTRIQGQTNLDTNAYGSYAEAKPWMGLTITEPLTDTFWLANNKEVKQVPLLQL